MKCREGAERNDKRAEFDGLVGIAWQVILAEDEPGRLDGHVVVDASKGALAPVMRLSSFASLK
jgi:hypothetical protein